MPPPRRPEILAPAGDADAMRAAIDAGADAVYFGLQGFNARARATNFDAAGLAATMRTLHERGVRGYVALNTLVFDAELAGVEAAIRTSAEAGVDAIIVQDLGVARLARAIAPELPIHASTQMTCTDASSVDLARSLGASRVILARELSLDDIAAIRASTDAEIEVFVHGALCIAYSGQCLTSEAIGGRSANRGACAQACRLPYELVVDGVKRDLGEHAYLLSPEDLETSALIPRLVELGVSSLKIEGRLKGPEYVAATTRLYRHAVDAAMGAIPSIPEDDRRAALQQFSRGSGPGFLAGVDHQRLVEGRACDHRGVLAGACEGVRSVRGRPHLVVRAETPLARGDGLLVEGGFASEGEVGGRVWTLLVNGTEVDRVEVGQEALVWLGPDKDVANAVAGHRVWKTNDPSSEKEVRQWLARDPHRVAVDVVLTGRFGEPYTLEATTDRGVKASVTAEAPVERARTSPTTVDAIREKLAKLGDTPFALRDLRVELPEGAMLPLASLNRARRALADALTLRACDRAWSVTTTSHVDLVERSRVPDRAPPPRGLFVLCRTLEQANAAIDAGADGVYLDFLELTGTGAALRVLRDRKAPHVGVAPPRIRKPGEEKIDRYLASLAPDAILVRSLGSLGEIDASCDAGIPRIGDFALNVTNSITACDVLARGLAAFTPSFDLDASQLDSLLSTRGRTLAPFAEVVVHHPMPLFHMEHCVIAALLSDGKDYKSCGRPCDAHKLSLRDRAGMDHPIEADVGCRNTVFHAAPQSAASLVPALQKHGVGRFRIELVREEAAEVSRVVGEYRRLIDGVASHAEVWRALKSPEGGRGYGVVRGSLRVIA